MCESCICNRLFRSKHHFKMLMYSWKLFFSKWIKCTSLLNVEHTRFNTCSCIACYCGKFNWSTVEFLIHCNKQHVVTAARQLIELQSLLLVMQRPSVFFKTISHLTIKSKQKYSQRYNRKVSMEFNGWVL